MEEQFSTVIIPIAIGVVFTMGVGMMVIPVQRMVARNCFRLTSFLIFVEGVLIGINTHYSAGLGTRIGFAALLGAVSCGGLVWAITLTRASELVSDAHEQPRNEIRMTQNTPSSVGPVIDQSVHSTNQSGGITARTVIQGNPKYNFASPSFDGLKAQMVAALPKDKPLTVMALMGNSSSIDLALQVRKYLGDQGFKMKEDGISQGVFSSVPKGISYNEHDNSVVVGEPE